MKPLTKTIVSRGGGIAARFAPAEPKPEKPARPAKPKKKEPFDRITYQREYMRQWRAKRKEQP